jgi:hypothetical protein
VQVCEEFSVEMGAARIDLAIVGEHLEGFELKSDLDTFSRLAEQMHTYNRVFDQITLVTGRLFEGAARALMPPWWGLVIAEHHGEQQVDLIPIRPPAYNPIQNPRSLAMLLWRDEVGAILEYENILVAKRASRAVLHEQLALAVPFERLRQHVLRCLRTRAETRALGRLAPNDDLLHHVASCSDSHYSHPQAHSPRWNNARRRS